MPWIIDVQLICAGHDVDVRTASNRGESVCSPAVRKQAQSTILGKVREAVNNGKDKVVPLIVSSGRVFVGAPNILASAAAAVDIKSLIIADILEAAVMGNMHPQVGLSVVMTGPNTRLGFPQ